MRLVHRYVSTVSAAMSDSDSSDSDCEQMKAVASMAETMANVEENTKKFDSIRRAVGDAMDKTRAIIATKFGSSEQCPTRKRRRRPSKASKSEEKAVEEVASKMTDAKLDN